MKKRICNFLFLMQCCIERKLMGVIAFFLLFLVLHYEKNYLTMCYVYDIHSFEFNSYAEYMLSDGIFQNIFLPIIPLVISWKVYPFICCNNMRMLKYKNRIEVMKCYSRCCFLIIILVMSLLLGLMFLVAKINHMDITQNLTFLLYFLFTCFKLILVSLLYFGAATVFSSNGMGAVAIGLLTFGEILIWKNAIEKAFRYVFYYHIIEQDMVAISLKQKFLFWAISFGIVIISNMIIVRFAEFGVNKTVKDALKHTATRWHWNLWYAGAILWIVVFVFINWHTSCQFYTDANELVYICLKGFSASNIINVLYYLGLCVPLWIYLIFYFSRFFNTFSIYVFTKTGNVMRYIMKCLIHTLKHCTMYFVMVVFVAGVVGYATQQDNVMMPIYQELPKRADGIIGLMADYILVTVLIVLFIMSLYLLCYRLDVAFIIGVTLHILSVIVADMIPYGKEWIPFTQNMLLLREEGNYNWMARCVLALTICVVYAMFSWQVKRKQEKIMNGCYK